MSQEISRVIVPTPPIQASATTSAAMRELALPLQEKPILFVDYGPAHDSRQQLRIETQDDSSTLQRPALDHVVLRQPQLAVDEGKFVDREADRLDRLHANQPRAVEQRHMRHEVLCRP